MQFFIQSGVPLNETTLDRQSAGSALLTELASLNICKNDFPGLTSWKQGLIKVCTEFLDLGGVLHIMKPLLPKLSGFRRSERLIYMNNDVDAVSQIISCAEFYGWYSSSLFFCSALTPTQTRHFRL
jgi:hypothetical protein